MIDAPVNSPDFFPTFLAAAGVKPASDLPPDGVNLLPLLTQNRALPERALFWHYPHNGNQGGAPGASVRRGDWKLIEWFEDGGTTELFNLRTDPVGNEKPRGHRARACAGVARRASHVAEKCRRETARAQFRLRSRQAQRPFRRPPPEPGEAR